MNKMVQITEASKPDELIESLVWDEEQKKHVLKDIPYQKWCYNKVMDVKHDPTRKAEVGFDKQGKCSVWADEVGKEADKHSYKAKYPRQNTVIGSKRLKGKHYVKA